MYYFSVVVDLPTKICGTILTDDPLVDQEADLEVSRYILLLNESGIAWKHAYYWPGDKYYAFAKSKSRKELRERLAKAIKANLVQIQELPSWYKTHQGNNTVAAVMKRKSKSFVTHS